MERTDITAREIRLLAVLALVAGIVFDYLFYGKAIGVFISVVCGRFLLPILDCFHAGRFRSRLALVGFCLSLFYCSLLRLPSTQIRCCSPSISF